MNGLSQTEVEIKPTTQEISMDELNRGVKDILAVRLADCLKKNSDCPLLKAAIENAFAKAEYKPEDIVILQTLNPDQHKERYKKALANYPAAMRYFIRTLAQVEQEVNDVFEKTGHQQKVLSESDTARLIKRSSTRKIEQWSQAKLKSLALPNQCLVLQWALTAIENYENQTQEKKAA